MITRTSDIIKMLRGKLYYGAKPLKFLKYDIRKKIITRNGNKRRNRNVRITKKSAGSN